MNGMEREKRVKAGAALAAVFILLLGALGCVYALYVGGNLAEISVPDFVSVNRADDGTYSFSLDTDAIRKEMYFPPEQEGAEMPELSALDSLSLLCENAGSYYIFQTGSTLPNVRTMLENGGYRLVDTEWSWTQNQAAEAYTRSLTREKTVSIRKFTDYKADGNGNWTAFLDIGKVKSYVGDRVRSNARLAECLESLTLSSSVANGVMHVETATSFSGAPGLTVDTVLESCGVSVTDIVFDIPLRDVRVLGVHPVSMEPYYVVSGAGQAFTCDIDRQKMKSELGFASGTDAAAAIDSLRVQVTVTVGGYRINVCYVLPDRDAIEILRSNGIELTDLSMTTA